MNQTIETDTVSIKEGNRRLLVLARKLERLPPERFDLNKWVGYGWKGKQDLSCGTTACAIGWAATMPCFRKLGVRLVPGDMYSPVDMLGLVVPEHAGCTRPVYVACKLFGITEQESLFLFSPHRVLEGRQGLAGFATAAEVATHIRDFVKRRAELERRVRENFPPVLQMKRYSLAPKTRIDLKDYIQESFSDSGPFAKAFPGYQKRDGQVEFSEAVADAIQDKVILLAEAATGTGKSVSYLLPTIKSICNDGGKAVIVTANIALQEQLIKKDLPDLHSILGLDFTYALAKGYSNYVCQARRDENDADRVMGKLRLPLAQDQALFERVANWVTETGDLSEFDTELPGMVKSLVTSSSEECYGSKCSFYNAGCFPRAARTKFGASDIIVTNYHLYFLDLELRRMGLPASILPDHRILILDEAHEASAIARSYLGERTNFHSVKTALDALDARDKRASRLGLPPALNVALKGDTEAEANRFFGELLKIRRNKAIYKARLDEPGMIDGSNLEAMLKDVSSVYIKASHSSSLENEAKNWLKTRANLCLKQANVIRGSRELDPDDHIFYIDDQNDKASLVREPLFPSAILREHLFEKDAEPRSIALCSATLTTSSKSPFAYTANQLGIRKFDECVAESPFDFTKTAFIVPKGLPEPNSQEFALCVAEILLETINAAKGRTLGLFTSYRVLDFAKKFLIKENLQYKLLCQGDAPRSLLVKAFKEDVSSVLLGTDSLWTGVDVPGEALTALVIDRIPFDHPDDPVLDAVTEHDKNWFKNYYLPKAVIQFKQGFGRLVRSVNDHGVVVCCDKRITSKPYGRAFQKAVPPETEFSENLHSSLAKYLG